MLLILMASLCFFAVLMALLAVRVVPRQTAYVIERKRQYHCTLSAGFHFVNPFTDSIRAKVSLTETALPISQHICITSDNVALKVDWQLFFRVIDPQKSVYGTDKLLRTLTKQSKEALEFEIRRMNMDDTFIRYEEIADKATRTLSSVAEHWGVKILGMKFGSITPPQEIMGAMSKQIEAQRINQNSLG